MKIEVGKYYRTRDGKTICGPIELLNESMFGNKYGGEIVEAGPGGRVVGSGWYGESGHYWEQPTSGPFDLVEEVPKPENAE